jgi:protein TonB
MFDSTAASGRKRLVSGLLAAGLQAGLVLVLLYGLAAPSLRAGMQSALTSLDLRTLPPPAPPPQPSRHAARRAGQAAPPARRAQAAPFVAPRVVPLKPPPVIPVAPVSGQGVASSAGAAAAGNGSGADGQGNGTGAGGAGEGDGGGDGDGAELVSGRIKSSDTPANLFHAPFSGTTRALVLIDARGGVADCRIQRSSGNATLDALTCRLIAARFRFRSARDAAGRAVAGKIIYEHDWEVGGGFDSDPPR